MSKSAWWLPENYKNRLSILKGRAELIRAIRAYFDKADFLEVETPILQTCPVMDTHIHGFKTKILKHDLSHDRDMYLHTSPEFAMKKLLVAGLPRIYQICHVFRNAEGSSLHSPEFTMIEWYKASADYKDIMNDCVELIRYCAMALDIKELKYKEHSCNPFDEWQRITVRDAFLNYADIDLDKCLNDISIFSETISKKGIRVADDDQWDDLFFRVMAEKIEPHLGMNTPTILYDYPVSMASLSRKKPGDNRYAERFELYICGIELANAFSELTDAKEQEIRFHEELKAKKELYGYTNPIDQDCIDALSHGMPEAGGIALGVDRLAMLFTHAENIEQVLWAGRP